MRASGRRHPSAGVPNVNGYPDTYPNQHSVSAGNSKSDKKQKAIERKEYSRICKSPVPPSGDQCSDAKNNLNRLKTCLNLRQKFSQKWYNDGDSGHLIEINNTKSAIKNLEKWIRDNCDEQCD